jgi:hypothetical protein
VTGGHSGAAFSNGHAWRHVTPGTVTCIRCHLEDSDARAADPCEPMSLVEREDRDHPDQMSAARAVLAREGGEPVQRRRCRECGHARCRDAQRLDAVVAREIGGLGDSVTRRPCDRCGKETLWNLCETCETFVGGEG